MKIGFNSYETFSLEPSIANMSVNTENPGFDVYLDEEFVGKTPIMNKSLCSGEYFLKVIFPDRRTFFKVYNLKKGDAITIFAVPKPSLAFLGVFSKHKGEYIDDISNNLFNSFKDISARYRASVMGTPSSIAILIEAASA